MVEHYLDTVGVTGSNPVSRTTLSRDGATRLKPFGKTLKDAIDFYLSHLIALQSSISARELDSRIVARFDRRMRAGEISTRYLESIKYTLGKFAGKYENESIASLSGVEIKEWLANLPLSAQVVSAPF